MNQSRPIVGLGMINSLKVALLHGHNYISEIEAHHARVFRTTNLKNLVRLLLEKPVDLIVIPTDTVPVNKLIKIYDEYQVPVLFVGGKTPRIKQSQLCFGWAENVENINSEIINMSEKIKFQRIHRENVKVRYIIDNVRKFSDTMVYTTKDLFISGLKEFFKRSFKMDSCHWVEVKPSSSKLPPILKLKNELENQKVSQLGLIRDLDNCTMEVCYQDEFQIWKTNSGDYLVMIWIPQSNNTSQCVILNKIKIKNHNHFRDLIHDLSPLLKRRWDICLRVGEAQEQVYQDSLTSLYNQRFLTEVLDKKIEENKRYKTPFSVLFIDVDHFKRVNDSLGHVIGSGVLMKLGDLLKKQIRNSDYAFRYGGDEFIILLSHTEGEDAVLVSERIRAQVEKENFEFDGIKVKITVSIGLAFFPEHAKSAESIIRIADEAMYYGKNKSRNIVYKAS